MGIKITVSGDYAKTERYLTDLNKGIQFNNLDRYGQAGVDALSSATPLDSGETASGWGYRIKKRKDSVVIEWTNSNVVDGVPIAVILQYGHGTRNGGYVQGRDYINPAIRSIFDQIVADVWKEVSNS